MSASSPVLILGGTGNIGRAIAHLLHSRGVPVIATVRDTAKAQSKLPSGTQLVQVDFNDPNTLQQAVQSSQPKRAYALVNAVNKDTLATLKAGGVTHIVYISTAFIGLPTEPIALQTWQSGAENAIKGAGFTYTFLRAEAFMSNCNSQSHTTLAVPRTSSALSQPHTHSPILRDMLGCWTGLQLSGGSLTFTRRVE